MDIPTVNAVNLPKRTSLGISSLEPKHLLEKLREARLKTIDKGFFGPFIALVPQEVDLTQEADDQGRTLSRRILSIADVVKVSKHYSPMQLVTVAQYEGEL